MGTHPCRPASRSAERSNGQDRVPCPEGQREQTGEPLFANRETRRQAPSASSTPGSPRRGSSTYSATPPATFRRPLLHPHGIPRSPQSGGFRVNGNTRLCRTIDEVVDHYNHIRSIREEIPYEIDGTVIKVNRIDHQTTLGTVSRSPRWASPTSSKRSKRRRRSRTSWSVSAGRVPLTPVAALKPVPWAGWRSHGPPFTTRTR